MNRPIHTDAIPPAPQTRVRLVREERVTRRPVPIVLLSWASPGCMRWNRFETSGIPPPVAPSEVRSNAPARRHRTTDFQGGEVVKSDGELLHDLQKLERLGVTRRRLDVRASLVRSCRLRSWKVERRARFAAFAVSRLEISRLRCAVRLARAPAPSCVVASSRSVIIFSTKPRNARPGSSLQALLQSRNSREFLPHSAMMGFDDRPGRRSTRCQVADPLSTQLGNVPARDARGVTTSGIEDLELLPSTNHVSRMRAGRW